jgi:hypothetical protein
VPVYAKRPTRSPPWEALEMTAGKRAGGRGKGQRITQPLRMHGLDLRTNGCSGSGKSETTAESIG